MSDQDKLAALEAQVQALTRQVGLLEDTHAVRTLHHKYGYYIDKCLYQETVELFAEDAEVRFFGGIYKGKAGARRLYIDRFQKRFTGGKNGPVYGFLLDHPQMQDVVTVAPDGQTAQGRFRCFMQAGRHALAEGDTRQWWEGGLYENRYVKEHGVWKIQVLDYRPVFHADYDTGWAHTKPQYLPFFDTTYPADPLGPDALMTDPAPVLWPDMEVMDFHYPHPVTGAPWKK